MYELLEYLDAFESKKELPADKAKKKLDDKPGIEEGPKEKTNQWEPNLESIPLKKVDPVLRIENMKSGNDFDKIIKELGLENPLKQEKYITALIASSNFENPVFSPPVWERNPQQKKQFLWYTLLYNHLDVFADIKTLRLKEIDAQTPSPFGKNIQLYKPEASPEKLLPELPIED